MHFVIPVFVNSEMFNALVLDYGGTSVDKVRKLIKSAVRLEKLRSGNPGRE